jgi:SNF2 family DNA or RNA helicase
MRKFVKEEADTTRLRMIVAPFMLRRVKTDETLGLNLPEKEVTRTDCALTTEQFSAYEKEHELMVTHLAGLDGVARRGSILSGLTRLKQVCVHPMLTPAGSVSSIIEGRSGKISKLETIVKEAISQGEAVVVFTQFASFLPHLARHLDEALNIEALTIDGTMSRKARDKSLKEFMNPEGPPVLLCSLKTGGVGLNLVRASNVVHLDRWWNPAVEDQASDRVWRIGQNQDVNVHLLVCPGTLEDKIDQLLSSKRLIAGQVVTQSEASLTELDDAALENLVSLVKDRILWEEVE